VPGKGAKAVVDGNLAYIGNRRLVEELKLDISRIEALEEKIQDSETVMFVGTNGSVIGAIVAADTLRETTADALVRLRAAGVRKMVMITGDNATAAESVAGGLDFDDVHANLLPEEKVDIVKDLVRKHGRAAMVGDGINDAPALAAATVGVAMGGAGAHAVLETADMTLMADDLAKLPYSMTLSRQTLRVIKQNVGFAVLVVTALVLLTLTGHMKLPYGVIGHEGSALLVIANGMRLLKVVNREQ
jgi:Zn2+/Cd2+-exporting ATPase